MKLSLIIPVYNRPDEVEELLESLTQQSERNFEVILVEDGSQTPCDVVAERFKDRLELSYYAIPNGGPGHARNYGAKQSKGDYLIVLDSDCILPPGYIQAVNRELEETNADAFGGPDRAHDSFTNVQKAISYSMTSFFTTGGIRGGKKKLEDPELQAKAEESRAYFMQYVTEQAKNYGLIPFIWDDGWNFPLMDRRNCKVIETRQMDMDALNKGAEAGVYPF